MATIKKKKEPLYNLKTTLFHKVQRYSFDEDEMKIMQKAVSYADSGSTYNIYIEEHTADAVVISLEGVPESEKDTAVKDTASKISWFMCVSSDKVRRGLREKRFFMFKGSDACPTEEKRIS